MPAQTVRESLKTDLESRYSTQRVGGAFDATSAGTMGLGDMGIQERTWTKAGFVKAIDEGLGLNGTKQYDRSLMRQGFDNRKYKP